jgi:hypothetical protein
MSSSFFADMGDGLQSVWNIWWLNTAVTELHTSPWYTTYLNFPQGTSLLSHTLNPFNGFLAIFLLPFFTLIETYNLIVVFSFVMGGYTSFLLARSVTRSYGGSLLAGFIFTFSPYHFAHAQGHLQLVSLEWIPLFILLFRQLLLQPRLFTALGAGVTLFAVLLCDYYYFFYSCLAAVGIALWLLFRGRTLGVFFRREYRVPLAAFVATTLATSGLLIFTLLFVQAHDPFTEGHPSTLFSLDLFSLFIPGGHWLFGRFTEFYWSRLPASIHETSVSMGVSVLLVLLFVWRRRKQIPTKEVTVWFGLLLFFFIMSLGPRLHIWGWEVPFLKLPYIVLEKIFPLLVLSGVPVRMMVMVMLCASVLVAMGWGNLRILFAQRPWLQWGFLALLLLEYLPTPLPLSNVPIPEYVHILKDAPSGAVLDTMNERVSLPLYYQIIHGKPMAFGYISRDPISVQHQNAVITFLLEHGDFSRLHTIFGIRYLVLHPGVIPVMQIDPKKALYRSSEAELYDLTLYSPHEGE